MESQPAKFALLKNLFFLLLGIVVGITLWAVKDIFYPRNNSSQKPTYTQEFSLTIDQPKDFLATTEKVLTVSGKTGTKAVVTIANGSEVQTLAGRANFSTKINLNEGKNIISVSAFDIATRKVKKATRTILYLNEDLTSL